MGHDKKPTEEEGQEKNNADEEICNASTEAASANANVDDDDKEIDEVEEEEEEEEEKVVVRSDKTFHERFLLIMEKFASYKTGQEVVQRTDRMLQILEDTAKWSVPAAPEVKLQRPLPWIPFLALLILMRMTRFWCSVVSFATRLHPVRPQEMVYFFQNRRRTLRVVRINGLKTIRNREQQPTLVCRHPTIRNVDESFLRRLRSLLKSPSYTPSEMPSVPRRYPFSPFGRKMSLAELETETEPQHEPSTSNDNTEGKERKRVRKSKKRKDDTKDLRVNEMLDKYANEGTDDTDPDYDPRDDEDDHRSASSNCSSSAEEPEKENVQAAAEAAGHNENAENVENGGNVENVENGQNMENVENVENAENAENVENVGNVENVENNDNEIKENGHSKPEVANERGSETDSDIEVGANENGSSETVQQNSDSDESNEVKSKVAPDNHTTTPITNPCTHLAVASLQEEENKQKSTPGHETAASLKPPVVTSSSTESQKSKQNKAKAEEKCYRTITTQTCLEIDWSITIKTEITHRRTRPNLENLNYSVQLTPATSDEDIFYSPIGSPQDFHSIFHPAPIVKGSTTEAQPLTPQRTEQLESSNNEATPEAALNSPGPKKNNNYNHCNQNQKRKSRNRRNRR